MSTYIDFWGLKIKYFIANQQKTGGRVSDDEAFARILFYGVTLLGRDEREVWLMPFGHLLDQWEIYK